MNMKKNDKMVSAIEKVKRPYKQNRQPRRFCITLEDLIFCDILIGKFKALEVGTAVFKAQNYAEIMLILNPNFDSKDLQKTNLNKMEYLRLKGVTLLCNTVPTRKNRIYKHKCENLAKYTEIYQKTLDYIENHPKIKFDHKDLKRYNDITPEEFTNLLRNQYCSAGTRQVLVFDTTKLADNFFVTFLIDNGSHKILTHLVTKGQPSGSELIYWFECILTDELIKRILFIHIDKSGENISYQFREYMKKRNIKLSYTEGKNENQVAEATNKGIQTMINSRKFDYYDKSVEFKDLTFEEKNLMLETVIELYNYTPCSKDSLLLQGYSKELVDSAKEYIRKIFPETIDNSFLIGGKHNVQGKLVALQTAAVTNFFKTLIEQQKFFEETDKNYNLVSETDLKDIATIAKEQDVEKAEKIKQTQIEKYNIMQELSIKNSKIDKSKHTSKEIIQILMGYLKNKIEQAKTEKEKSEALYKLGLLKLEETLKEEQEERDKTLQNTLIELTGDRSLILDTNVQTRKKVQQMIDKMAELKYGIVKRNKVTPYKRLNKQAIMPEDFWDYIVPKITEGEVNFTTAKYCLAHLLLKLYGIRISNLRYFNFVQLDNLFNKKEVIIILIKKQKLTYISFPYNKAMDPYLKAFRKYYSFMKKCQKENHKELYVVDKNSADEKVRLTSEIWGRVDRSGLTRFINKQLNEIGNSLKPKKKFTSHSYRKGIAILLARRLGILEAKYFLGHESISTTQAYLENETDRKRMRRAMTELYNIKNSSEVEYKKHSEEEEKIISKDIRYI